MTSHKFLVMFVVFMIGILQRGVVAESEEEAGEEQVPKQGGYYAYGQNPYGYYPVNYQLQRYPQAYYQQSYYPYYPSYPAPQPPKPSRQGLSRVTYFAFLYYLFGLLTTAAPTTEKPPTTAAPADCPWGAWQACNAICNGQRTRSRTCSGITQTQTEACNPPTGLMMNGWYRASNCYDYFVSPTTTTTQDLAQAACEGLSGRLASAGMRSDTVRAELMSNLYTINGNAQVQTFIGVETSSGAWTDAATTWSDSVSAGAPTFWDFGEPGASASDCAFVVLGNTNSLRDTSCTTTLNYLCERAAQ